MTCRTSASPLVRAALALILACSWAISVPVHANPPVATPAPEVATDAWQPWDGKTLAWQTLGGAAGGVGGALAGMVFSAAYIRLDGSSGDGFADLGLLLFGGMVGGFVGMSAGTWWAGDLSGGNGGLGWTFGGTLLGTIGGFAVGSNAGSAEAALALGLIGGIAGGMAAYHLSASPGAPGPISAVMRVGSDGRLYAGVPLAVPVRGLDGRVSGWQLSLVSGRF